MSFSHKSQKIVAITLGVVLIGVIGAILVRDNPSENLNGTDSVIVNDQAATQQQITESTEPEAETADTNDAIEVTQNTTESSVSVDNGSTELEESEEPAETTESTEAEETTNPTKTAETEETDSDTADDDYIYTAVSGDSYTAFARLAVQEYSTANNLNLTYDQIVKTAAIQAVNAGLPFLEIGQIVTIQQSDVSAVLGRDTGSTPQDKAPVATPAPVANEGTDEPTVASYSYVAVAGDSYSLLARKTIGDYANTAQIDLSSAQRIAAETYIISQAGFPRLDIDQAVTFTKDSIKDAVAKSTNLSATELSNWIPYATLAGF